MKKIVILLIAGAVVLSNASFAFASLLVDPTVVEISLERGEVYQGMYKVGNSGDEKISVKIEPENWMRRFLQREDAVEVEDWLSFDQTEFELEPNEVKEIPFTAQISDNMESEHVAQIFFTFQKVGGEPELFRTRLGVIFYITIKGTENLEASITEFTLNTIEKEDGTKDLKAVLKIMNTGNVHIRPFGEIIVRKKDEVVGKIEIKKSKGIYDQRGDTIEGILKDVKLKKGTYEAEAVIQCGMYDKEYTITGNTEFVFKP